MVYITQICNYQKILYSSLRKTYLREHHPVLYMDLLLSGISAKHLADINEAAHERMDLIVKQMAERQRVNEQLKSSDSLSVVIIYPTI